MSSVAKETNLEDGLGVEKEIPMTTTGKPVTKRTNSIGCSCNFLCGQCGSSRSEDLHVAISMYSISRGAGRPSHPCVHSFVRVAEAEGRPAGPVTRCNRRPVESSSTSNRTSKAVDVGRSKTRLLLLPPALFPSRLLPFLGLLLLTLMACRPCHGHDPELLDMDDEDGKFQMLVWSFIFSSLVPIYLCSQVSSQLFF